MRIEAVDPRDLDLDTADALAEISRAAQADVPVPHPGGASFLLAHTIGDGERPADGIWVASEGGKPVGYAVLELPQHEYTDVAFVRGAVLPAHQGRGVATSLLSAVSAGTERRYLRARAWSGTVGEQVLTGWGFEPRLTHVVRRLSLEEARPDWAGLRREAERAAADYELVRRAGPTPHEGLAEMVLLREAINDAPDAHEYEAYPPERISAYEQALVARRQTQYTVLARHRSTQEPAGITMVCVDELMPSSGHQEDTSVVRAHRGHRLGLLLKLEMIEWLREERPEVLATDTWNDKGNHHMIAVNERLGAAVVAENVAFRRSR